jgi:hypothetical protein
MEGNESPLIFSRLVEVRRPIIFGTASLAMAMIGGPYVLNCDPLIQQVVFFITGALAGPLFIWAVVRWVNRRDDARKGRCPAISHERHADEAGGLHS